MTVGKPQVNLKRKDYRFGFHQKDRSVYKTQMGLTKNVVQEISFYKNEPDWMRKMRLSSFSVFEKKTIPSWGADLSKIDLKKIYYYINPSDKKFNKWRDVPKEIKETYDRIGIPEAEKKFLAGVGAQYDSEMIYHSLKDQWEKQGVIFTSMDEGLKKYPDIIKRYFGSVVPPDDNKFAALNSAVWSGGSFIYVPRDVQVTIPLQAYFRMNHPSIGQFERTLIIADRGSSIHYIEGCTAPIYSTDSLHAAVVEVIVKKGARVRYTTVQNWSNNVYNLVTKRMLCEEDAIGEWVDGNLGSKTTMKYPSVVLKGKRSKANILSLAFAGFGQHLDCGGKIIHLAPYTSGTITSKSICMNGGRTSYRGLIKMVKGVRQSKSYARCDSLILDNRSRADTYPTSLIEETDVNTSHEALVSRLDERQLYYLMSRGLDKTRAISMMVNGFIEPIIKELPLEYAVELNRLINYFTERLG